MKLFKAVMFMAALFLLFSCAPGADRGFDKLKQHLPGTWESAGNVRIFFRWEDRGNELSGYSFSPVGRGDTLFINQYTFYKKEDSLILDVSVFGKGQPEKFRLERCFFGNLKFRNTNSDHYPFFITFDLNDDGWTFTQSNERGNKKVKFVMKKSGSYI
jgi:hypothetical protein